MVVARVSPPGGRANGGTPIRKKHVRQKIRCAGKTSALRAAPLRGAETGVLPPPARRGETPMSTREKCPPTDY